MIINIRGTNGSGKSTVAMKFIKHGAEEVVLAQYPSPTKKEPDRLKDVIGYVSNWADYGTVCVVGPYDRQIGGLDRIPSFEAQRNAIRAATKIADTVICEGVLASTVYSSWAEFFKEMGSVTVLYLDTPLETCYDRIKQRQIEATGEAKEIKTEQVAAKVKMIESTRQKFAKDGLNTLVVSSDEATDYIRQLIVRERTEKGSPLV
jgi:thymidylate kinase